MKKEKITILSMSAGTIISLGLNGILIPIYGSTGAAVATLSTELIVSIIIVFMAKNMIKWKIFNKNLIQVLMASIFMSIIITLLSKLIPNPILKICLLIPVGSMCYLASLILFKNETAYSLLKKSIHKKEVLS
jgi:O-antigen/teichoic acid export membrane protein